MDSAVLSLAKELVVYDTKDLDKVIATCEKPALIMLSRYAPIDKMSSYVSRFVHAYTSVEQGSTESLSRFYLNTVLGLKAGCMITIELNDLTPSPYVGTRIVESVDVVNNSIELRVQFITTEAGFMTNNSVDNMLYAHAYLILKLFALHSQSIVKGDVIYSSQQFGQGTIAPASMSEKKNLADKYHNLALSLIGNFKGSVI